MLFDEEVIADTDASGI